MNLPDDFDVLAWFEENESWLRTWLDCKRQVPFGQLQVFVVYRDRARYERELLLHCVFSQEHELRREPHLSLWCMSGFVEQVGRLPTAEDQVELLVHDERLNDYCCSGLYRLEVL